MHGEVKNDDVVRCPLCDDVIYSIFCANLRIVTEAVFRLVEKMRWTPLPRLYIRCLKYIHICGIILFSDDYDAVVLYIPQGMK